jgi:selenophosphate synthase
MRLALADAQTSGGLLIAVAPHDVERLSAAFLKRGVSAWRIGDITAQPGQIELR